MTTLHERIETPLALQDTFDFIADFSNSARWDPGVATATRLDDRPLGMGSRFDLGVRMAGRVSQMEYVITTWQPPQRVVLTGSGSALPRSTTFGSRRAKPARWWTTSPTSGCAGPFASSPRSPAARSRGSPEMPVMGCSVRSMSARRPAERDGHRDHRVGHQRLDCRLGAPSGPSGHCLRGRGQARRPRQDDQRRYRSRRDPRGHRVHRL